MTRGSIDLGIDLGTTNSAIALLQRGLPFVIPNNRGQLLTPSVVRLTSDGATRIGTADAVRYDAENVAAEFKRLMGQPETVVFPTSGRELNPTELSAEVLKSLLADAERYANEQFPVAVVTVPAAFDLNQCAATEEAARQADLGYVELLQEPVAASLAFGYRVDLEGQNWLTYDLGGGTFDLALVGVRENRVQVLDHEGDNHLGGKNFDWEMVDQLVLPRLAEHLLWTALPAQTLAAEVTWLS